MPKRASGTFEVKLSTQPPDEMNEDTGIGRMLIAKQFQGALEATSKGQMLAASSAVNGSASYVALEQVSGQLDGLSGTFFLQHNGTMTRGTPQLSITVVPDSGTDQLAGLSGKMEIIIEDGKHSYEFLYSLDETT
jgi:hypothetical protein